MIQVRKRAGKIMTSAETPSSLDPMLTDYMSTAHSLGLQERQQAVGNLVHAFLWRAAQGQELPETETAQAFIEHSLVAPNLNPATALALSGLSRGAPCTRLNAGAVGREPQLSSQELASRLVNLDLVPSVRAEGGGQNLYPVVINSDTELAWEDYVRHFGTRTPKRINSNLFYMNVCLLTRDNTDTLLDNDLGNAYGFSELYAERTQPSARARFNAFCGGIDFMHKQSSGRYGHYYSFIDPAAVFVDLRGYGQEE